MQDDSSSDYDPEKEKSARTHINKNKSMTKVMRNNVHTFVSDRSDMFFILQFIT